MSLVTIIIPTRRRHDLLARALTSVLVQTHRSIQVVVVDDNDSGDGVGTRAELATLLADVRVVVVTESGGHSAAAARNRGLAAAHGDWITYLDDDDEYTPDKVARQLALAQQTASPLVVCGFVYQLGARHRLKQVAGDCFEGDAVLTEATWGTPFLFHRRDLAARFDENLRAGEDTMFAFDFMRRHGVQRVPNVAAPLVIVHQQIERSNHHHRAHWRADRLVLFHRRAQFSRHARRHYLARARLAAVKHGGQSWMALSVACVGLLRVGGSREIRSVANAVLFRTGLWRRWLVS